MTAESARQWIYVSGDVDIDRPADDNNAIRAVNAVVRARARELGDQRRTGRPRFGVLVAGRARLQETEE
jgi:hypothetical protein